MTSRRSVLSFMIALMCADLLYRLLPLVVFLGIVALALVAAGVVKLSAVGSPDGAIQEIGLGFSVGIVASAVIKLVVFNLFS